MYKKEDIYEVIKKWNELYEKIYEIVKLHGEKDNVYYDITDVNQDSAEGPLLVQVEFYKWQDNNDKLICIEIELLTNEESFNNFKSEVEKIVFERKQKEKKNSEEKKKKEIEDALEVLRKNGMM